MNSLRCGIAVFTVTLIALLVASQSAAGPIQWGLRAGVNSGRLTYDGELPIALDHQSRIGLLGEVNARLQVSRRVETETGLGIESRGGRYEYEEQSASGVPFEYRATTALIHVVVPARVRFALASGSVRPTATLGTQVGMLLSAKENQEAKSEGRTREGQRDVEENFESFDFGLLFGGGVEFPLRQYRGFAEIEYQLGLADINGVPAEGWIDGIERKVRTRTWRLAIGVRF